MTVIRREGGRSRGRELGAAMPSGSHRLLVRPPDRASDHSPSPRPLRRPFRVSGQFLAGSWLPAICAAPTVAGVGSPAGPQRSAGGAQRLDAPPAAVVSAPAPRALRARPRLACVRRGLNRFLSVTPPPDARRPTGTRRALAPRPPSRPDPACARPAAGNGDTTAAAPCRPSRSPAAAARCAAGRVSG